MRSLLTGRMRVLEQSPDGLLHDAQPPAAVGVAASQLGRDGRPLVEPGAFFVDGSYAIRINSWNALAGVVITVRARFLNSDGRLINQEWQHTPNTNRTKATSDFPLGVGFPLNITCFASTGSPLIGQCFVQVQIISGMTGATLPLGTLLQDYVTAAQALAFPGSPIRSSIEGGGVLRFITGTNPGAGAEISEAVPTGARWQLLAANFVLACSVAAGNRRANFVHKSGATQIYRGINTNTIAAGATGTFTVSPLAAIATDGFGQFDIPMAREVWMLAAQTWGTTTGSIDVADQYSSINYLVREYLEAAA